MQEPGVLQKRIVQSGKRFWIALSEDEARRLELTDGDEVQVTITPDDTGIDWEALPHVLKNGSMKQ